MSGEILTDREGGIATVTIQAPERLNALSLPMWRQLKVTFEELSADEGVRAVVLRGAGDKAFAAGADIAEFEHERSDVAQATAYGAVIAEALTAVAGCRHPVVALIQGACVGGGVELICCADLRIAAQGCRFGIPVNRLGLVVAYDEMRGLVELVGKAAALEIVLEGRIFDAEEALAKGLVNRLVADDAVVEAAYATARRIAEGAPLVARWHKRFINRLLDPAPLSEAENQESFACFATEDFQTGYKAFLAKEKPVFDGR
ncbi:MAG: enoyl-CoA hydratase-related protein [Alphaproteobacteria bacterium]|jgi:enoyl-CoA hydratase/carnithine racemase|nr:enoyl-CoA hydratase-related protein [Alphaproteobacteria bacterium]